MTRYSKVKVLTFEGYGSEKKCEQAINQGIDKGWQPIDVSSYVPPDSRSLKVIAFMGKMKKEGAEDLKKTEKTSTTEKVTEPESAINEEKMKQRTEQKTEQKPADEMKEKGEKDVVECPRCGNQALKIEDDHSGYCDYCGYIVDDVRKLEEDTEPEKDTSQRPVF